MAIDDPLLPLQTSPQISLKSLITKKNLSILSGPLSCFLIFFFVELDGKQSSKNMLAVLAWVFLWWLTDAVPMAIASLAPLFLFPLFGIAASDDVAKAYMDDVIALVLGSFILALAVEHYNIHRRLALNITSLFCGEPLNPPILLLGICATTAFVSMWMHNTAAAVMMIPVATGILQRFPESESVHPDVKRFCKGVILGVIYSAAVGGMSTLTGTGVNLILVGIWESYFPLEKPISFFSWFLFAFPLALVIFFALWGILCYLYCPKGSEKVLSAYLDRAHLERELELLVEIYLMHFYSKVLVSLRISLLSQIWASTKMHELPLLYISHLHFPSPLFTHVPSSKATPPREATPSFPSTRSPVQPRPSSPSLLPARPYHHREASPPSTRASPFKRTHFNFRAFHVDRSKPNLIDFPLQIQVQSPTQPSTRHPRPTSNLSAECHPIPYARAATPPLFVHKKKTPQPCHLSPLPAPPTVDHRTRPPSASHNSHCATLSITQICTAYLHHLHLSTPVSSPHHSNRPPFHLVFPSRPC